MNKKTVLAITLGVLVPSAAIMLTVLLIWCCRRRQLLPSSQGYQAVQHDLDDEEIEFQRILERQADSADDDDDNEYGSIDFLASGRAGEEMDGEGEGEEEEMLFSAQDRSRLSLLEHFRQQLVDQHSLPSPPPPSSTSSAAVTSPKQTVKKDVSDLEAASSDGDHHHEEHRL